MFIFFTIPWFVIAVLILMILGVGVSVINFILEHIVVISIVLWLPILLLIRSAWKNKNYSMEEKLEWTLVPILQVPTYALIVLLMKTFVEDAGFFEMLLMLVEIPIAVCIVFSMGIGIALALKWLYSNVLKSSVVTVCLGIAASAGITYFLYNLG